MRTLIVFNKISNACKIENVVKSVFGGDTDVESSAKGALLKCSVEDFDLVLIEDYLSNVCGYEISSMIRSISHNVRTPIFVLNANQGCQT